MKKTQREIYKGHNGKNYRSKIWIEKEEYLGEVLDEVNFHQFERSTYAITTPDKLYIFDGGTTESAESSGDFYKNILGFDEIEAIFLSHYHNHHIGAIPRIIKYFDGAVKNVFSSGYRAKLDGNWEKETARTKELEELVHHYGINYQFLKEGDKVDDDYLDIHIISPSPKIMDKEPPSFIDGRSPNDLAQMAVLFKYGDFRLLLLGDPVRESNNITYDDYWFKYFMPALHKVSGTTKVNIVQLPHHGDKRLVDYDDWFYTLSPELCLIDNKPAFTEPVRLYLEELKNTNPSLEYYSHVSVPNAIKSGGFDIICKTDGTFIINEKRR